MAKIISQTVWVVCAPTWKGLFDPTSNNKLYTNERKLYTITKKLYENDD